MITSLIEDGGERRSHINFSDGVNYYVMRYSLSKLTAYTQGYHFVLIFKISVLENIIVLNFKKRAYFGLVCVVCLSYECILSI